MRTCAICGNSEESERNRLEAHEVNPKLFIHWQCYTLPEYQDWVKSQRTEDPVCDRYWEMMTVGKLTRCRQCNEHQAISPKAVGMDAGSWELHCTKCHRRTQKSLSGYTDKATYQQLTKLREDFLRSHDLESITEVITALADAIETESSPQNCRCGGRFSIRAKPRCVKCDEILIDSYFHISFKPGVPVDA
jgi:hypothetical protein